MGLFSWLFGSHRKPWQTKCSNCNHNVIMKHGRCYHRNYNPGLQPGQDGDSPDEFGYVEYTQKCKLCSCKKPHFKRSEEVKIKKQREVKIKSSPRREMNGQPWSQKEKEELKEEVKSGKS